MPLTNLRHLLGIEGLSPDEIMSVLTLAQDYAARPACDLSAKKVLNGMTLINLFYEDSTRTRTSFELAGKRLGADVVNMSVAASSVNKGETLIDTAATLNAMRCDLLAIRHRRSGAAHLLAQKVEASVINAGDGTHEHPTQALLDALTVWRHKKRLSGLKIVICGDISHSRVARSDIHCFGALGNEIRLCGPKTLIPTKIENFGTEVFSSMDQAVAGADVIIMLRIQKERMNAGLIPGLREYSHFWGLTSERLALAAPDAIVMHPGPMNRGVEIDSAIADDLTHSVIREQVEMGVCVRMAVLHILAQNRQIQTSLPVDHGLPTNPASSSAGSSAGFSL